MLRGLKGQCGAPIPINQTSCFFALAAARHGRYVETPLRNIPQEYWIAVGGNWLNDSLQGKYYLAGGPAHVTVPG